MTIIGWKVTDQFFDKRAVMSAAERANRRALMTCGAYVRRTARRSIKPPGKKMNKASRVRRFQSRLSRGRDPRSSRPGEAPRLQSTGTSRNLRLILFAYRPSSQSVIVGPVRFANKSGVNVPGVLEHGGRTRVRVKTKANRRGRRKSVRAASRPFMSPALTKEHPNFAQAWRNAIRK